MSEKKENVPKIRFPGFTDAWEQRRLGDVVKMVGGATPSKANKAYWDGDIVWLSSQEIKDRYVSTGTYTITEKAVRETATKVVPAFTPLIVSRSGILARMFPITLPTVDVAINQDIKALFFDSEILDTDFFVSQLEMKENTILTSIVKTGTTVQSVNMPDFEKLIISIPSIQEQKKIGKTFKNLGNLITLHQRKLNNVKNLKAGLLQKMFPKDDEDFPEIRFPGFTDAWEQRKLGDFVEEYIEKTTIQNQYPVLTSSQQRGIVLQEEYFANRQVTTDNNVGYFVLPKGYFTYRSRSDNNVFVFNRNDLIDKGIISYFYPVFNIINTDSEFFLRRINNGIERQVSTVAEGTGQHVLSLNKFKNIVTLFPRVEEQQQIGTFFKQLDHLITLHQRKLEHLQEQKKALLQQMFV